MTETEKLRAEIAELRDAYTEQWMLVSHVRALGSGVLRLLWYEMESGKRRHVRPCERVWMEVMDLTDPEVRNDRSE